MRFLGWVLYLGALVGGGCSAGDPTSASTSVATIASRDGVSLKSASGGCAEVVGEVSSRQFCASAMDFLPTIGFIEGDLAVLVLDSGATLADGESYSVVDRLDSYWLIRTIEDISPLGVHFRVNSAGRILDCVKSDFLSRMMCV